MRPDLNEAIETRTILFDGAMGTMLIGRGLPLGTAPERWVDERPDDVFAVHRAYAEAGADVLTTCTFGANRHHLARVGLGERARNVVSRAAELAREAAGDERWVAGDIGPIWPPMGSPDALGHLERHAAYAEQAASLKHAGCDLLLIETQIDLDEALLALDAASATHLPVAVTLTFGPRSADPRWPEPRPEWMARCADPAHAAVELIRAGAWAVGANCTLTASSMLPVVSSMVAAVSAPVLARPNAGQPRTGPSGEIHYDNPPESFARDLAELLRAGARIVGGCCGTTPRHLAAARRR